MSRLLGSVIRPYMMTCEECGFQTKDQSLIDGHDCETQKHGGVCEDWPCCGHEYGDCNGLLYGSDAAIKERVEARWNDPNIDPMDPMYDEPGW